MLGRAKTPETAEQTIGYLEGPLPGSAWIGSTIYLRGLEGKSALMPFGSQDEVYFTRHSLRGPANKIARLTLVIYNYSMGQTRWLHHVRATHIGELAYESPISPDDARHLAVGEGVLRLLQGFDREESERLIVAEFQRSQELLEEADKRLILRQL